MHCKRLILLLSCWFLSVSSVAQTFEVAGTLEDDLFNPMAGVEMVLVYDSGQLFTTFTNDRGKFKFTGLTDGGWATCFPKLSAEYTLQSPSCGFHHFRVEDQMLLRFSAKGSGGGVVVHFGSPKRPNGVIGVDFDDVLNGNFKADVVLYISGLGSYAPEFIDRVEITGFWDMSLLGIPPIKTKAVSIDQSLASSGGTFEAHNLVNGRTRYVLTSSNPITMASKEKMAGIQLKIPKTALINNRNVRKNLFFCMESVKLFQGNTLVDSIYNLGWRGILDFY